MASFFIISQHGDGLSIATKLLAEGHRVAMDIRDRKYALAGDGLVPKAAAPQKGATIVFDTTEFGREADDLRRRGWSVIGDSVLADRLEHDRGFAADTMQKLGIPTPQHAEFSDPRSASQFVRANPRFLAFKPYERKFTSYVAEDAEQMVNFLSGPEIRRMGVFMLQELADGDEISVEGWFDEQQWLRPVNFTVEEKKFLTGGLGPQIGCAGSVVWPSALSEPEWFLKFLEPMTPLLLKHGYVGPLDANTKGGLVLEWTPRFGYNAIDNLMLLFDGDFGDFLASVAAGHADGEMPLRSEYSTAVAISIPPFPYTEDQKAIAKTAGKLIRIDDEDVPFFSAWDVMAGAGGKLVTAGASGQTGAIMGLGETVEDSAADAYDRLSRVSLENIQYRTDIGERAAPLAEEFE